MKQRLKRLLVRLLSLLPGKPVILLESAPPLGDNTGALYRTLLAQGWNDRYRLVWVVPDPAAFRNVHEKNVSFAGTRGTWALLRLFWLRARAAAIVDCNGQLQKLRPETVHLYLTHGSPLKSVHDYYFCDPTTDWALSQAPFFDAVNSYEFHIPPEKLVTLGFPRNDDLFTHKCDLKDIFGAEFDRFVVWYPTYRQHKNNLVATTDISVPVIHDPAAAAAVNEAARATNTLVIVKPHPAQDLAHIRALELSHLRFIDDGSSPRTASRPMNFSPARMPSSRTIPPCCLTICSRQARGADVRRHRRLRQAAGLCHRPAAAARERGPARHAGRFPHVFRAARRGR